jgi:UDP-N-acetylenolpyruvoylglucosamine reductase
MNGGAYGREVADVLLDCAVILHDGSFITLNAEELDYSYRHSALPDGAIVVSARFRGHPGDPAAIGAEMDRIAAAREASQPLRTKTGGSTFKNPRVTRLGSWWIRRRLPGPHPGRRAGEREAHQLPHQHRHRHQRRHRGAGRNGARQGLCRDWRKP